MSKTTSDNFDIANAKQSKEPNIVLEIEGVPFTLASAAVFTMIRYDDPGIYYDGTYTYDGLRRLGNDKVLIDRKKSSSQISQKLEQWDGRSSIETMKLNIVDYNALITNLLKPGEVITDLLNTKVKVWFGYQDTSFREDYLKIFTGYVNNFEAAQGSVFLEFAAASTKQKTMTFQGLTTKINGAITDVATTINFISTDNFYRTILDALGNADSTVQIGIIIDNEIILYTNPDIASSTQLTGVTRGALSTNSAAHDDGAEVTPFIYLTDNPINIALKLMLSGWDGPCFENVNIRSFVNTDGGTVATVANSITFAQGVDLVRDYGLNVGDFITISGDITNPSNNAVWTVVSFSDSNRTVVVSGAISLIEEDPGSGYLDAVAAFRSKYDVYPVDAGLSMTTDDVAVSRHEYLRDTFLPTAEYTMPVKGSVDSGKEFIEKQLFKPIAGYSLTQQSRVSMGLTHPPLVDDLSKTLSPDNVINPGNIVVSRGLNERFFYNVIQFKFGYDVTQDKYTRTMNVVDSGAIERMRKSAIMLVEVKGLKDTPENVEFLQSMAQRLLLRYRYAAETIELEVNFATGNTIDAGDIVVLTDTDPPVLQITNTESGERGIMSRVMEVQERTIDISRAKAHLKLLANNGFSTTDRYGVIGPSSLVDGAGTTTQIRIKDSFFTSFPGAEWKKWVDYEGSTIKIFRSDFSFSDETTFTLDNSDPLLMNLDPPISFSPSDDDIVCFADYDDTDPNINAVPKATFPSLDPSATIASGSSPNVFTLDSGFASRYEPGMIVYVMSPDGTNFSPDVKILTIIGDIVTIGPIITGVDEDLGFTPSAGDRMELAGFLDGGSGYRLT